MKEGKTIQNERDAVLNMLTESRDHVEWKGDRFKPKTLKLTRLNTGKILKRSDFREVFTFVTYSEVSLSMNVVIDESFTITENQLTPVNTKVNTRVTFITTNLMKFALCTANVIVIKNWVVPLSIFRLWTTKLCLIA